MKLLAILILSLGISFNGFTQEVSIESLINKDCDFYVFKNELEKKKSTNESLEVQNIHVFKDNYQTNKLLFNNKSLINFFRCAGVESPTTKITVEDLDFVFNNFKELGYIRIDNLDSGSQDALFAFPDSFKNLTKLRKIEIDFKVGFNLPNELLKFENLESIELSTSGDIKYDNIFFQEIQKLKNLSYLSLSGSGFSDKLLSDEDIISLLSLVENGNLKRLYLPFFSGTSKVEGYLNQKNGAELSEPQKQIVGIINRNSSGKGKNARFTF